MAVGKAVTGFTLWWTLGTRELDTVETLYNEILGTKKKNCYTVPDILLYQ